MQKWERFIKKQEKKEAIVLSKSFWKPLTLQALKNRLQDKIPKTVNILRDLGDDNINYYLSESSHYTSERKSSLHL